MTDFRRLPKLDLHRHLEGSVRFETFCELAREVGIDLPRGELRRRTSMRGEKPGFLRFLSKFELYRGLYPSREWIERVAFEAAEDAKRDGVVYLELRFSPAHFALRLKAKGEDVAAWVVRGARRSGLDVRFVACFGRHFTLRQNEPTARAVEGTDFFSGLDLAGDESAPAEPFRALFRRLKLPVTLHAGEAGGPENIREAVDRFGARRIGHGVRVLEDPLLTEEARRRRIHFETCLTSEIQTGAARRWRGHPARRMFEAGLSVSLNTDDPSVCGIRLSDEFRKAAASGWSLEELRATVAEAARAAFAGAAARKALAAASPSTVSRRGTMIASSHDP
jgi:adenosine deaminase